MKSLELLRLSIFFVLAVDFGKASLIAFGRTRSKKINEQKTTEAPYVCLDSPIDLPACNFQPQVFEQFEQSSRQKRTLQYPEGPDLSKNLQELSSVEDPRDRYTRALTIVYKIEGCIPSRLPFDLPICQSEHINDRIIEVRRLFPFKVMGESERESGVPFVFPEFDYNKWRTFMKGPWTRPFKEVEDVEESSFEESNDSESDSNGEKVVKRKKFEDSKDDKSKGEKLSLIQLSKRMAENDLSSRSLVSKNRVTRDISKEMSSSKIETNKTSDLVKDEKKSEKDTKAHANQRTVNELEQQLIRNAEQLLRPVYESDFNYPGAREFPYADAIPHDTEKLQEARDSSEIHHDVGTSYDPKKLEKNRGEEMDGMVPFHTRKLKIVEETNEDDFRDVPFDKRMLAAAKLGGTFPYGKDVPEDTSENRETSKPARSPSPREAEEVRVPVRHVLQLASFKDLPNVGKTMPMTKEEENTREVQPPSDFDGIVDDEKQEKQAPRSNDGSKASLLIPRVVRGTVESSTNDLSTTSDNDEIPSRWSEFPYAKAIPFDPAKLRHQRSVHHENSIISVPHIFPYARAIPYDPWKLTSLVNNNQSIDQSSNLNDKDSSSRD